jgi:UDP-3-O-[3-hydroxymyristoyl] N-acetylglucosamine deacetylase
MCVHPAEPNVGVRFVRKDVSLGRGVIAALWHNATESRLRTTVANEFGTSVSTIEHLMAALRGCNVDNALIEIDGPEVPIMDGSAGAFVPMLEVLLTYADIEADLDDVGTLKVEPITNHLVLGASLNF